MKQKKATLDIPFIVKKEGTMYIAECVDLNIVTQGKTLKEAKKHIQEALNLHFKSAMEIGTLDDELDKLGVVKKDSKLSLSDRQLEHAPVQIPC